LLDIASDVPDKASGHDRGFRFVAPRPENGDCADDAEAAGSDFALTRSLAGLFEKWERPLGTHWLPERPFPKIRLVA